MCKIAKKSSEYLEDFVEVLDDLADICHSAAFAKGFHDDHENVSYILHNSEESNKELIKWFESTAEQAEIARMHSEASEWLEGIRKGQKPDEHLPEFLSAEVEAADLIIRVLDTCAKRDYRIGNALVAKLQYNASRPYKHGKNS